MELEKAIGLGVAGNFAGHLKQAGEAADFAHLRITDESAPKGIFPFYLPGAPEHRLGLFPVSHDRIVLPEGGGNVQIEPEVALICDLVYEGKKVSAVVPRRFAAYNDCSIRRPGARKISEKKNWGISTKGLSRDWIDIDRFARGGVMDSYRIASYLYRDGRLHTYGIDSPVLGYGYFYEGLQRWLVEKLNSQQDEGPLECIGDLLALAQWPRWAVISAGATRYTEFGETNFLVPGDESIVVVYDGVRQDHRDIEAMLTGGGRTGPADGISVLRQKVAGG